jgi:hypothetical protein
MRTFTKLSLVFVAFTGIYGQAEAITFNSSSQMEQAQVCQAATYYKDQSDIVDRQYFADTLSGKENILSRKEALNLLNTITASMKDNRLTYQAKTQEIEELKSIGQKPNLALHSQLWPADPDSFDFLDTRTALIKYATDCLIDPEA